MFLDPVLRGRYTEEVYELYRAEGLPELVRDGDEATIGAPLDFLGINHYHQVLVRHDAEEGHLRARATPAEPTATWRRGSVRPESLRHVLVRVGRENPSLPLSVTYTRASLDAHPVHPARAANPQRLDYLSRSAPA